MWIKTEIYENPFDKKPIKTIYADSVLELEGKMEQVVEKIIMDEI